MLEPDLYKLLQVDPEADADVIQAAYRRLAQKFHPDVAPDLETARRMILINQAWETLRDPVARSAYDRSRAMNARHSGVHGGSRAAGRPPGNPAGSTVRFGRYDGWTIGEIARTDIDYLEWLDRMPIGRPYRDEIDTHLRQAGRRRSASVEARERRGLFRGR